MASSSVDHQPVDPRSLALLAFVDTKEKESVQKEGRKEEKKEGRTAD